MRARIKTSAVGDANHWCTGRDGFTLLELLIVMAIIGLMVALIPGFLLRDNNSLDLDRAGRAVAEGLYAARSEAMTLNRDRLFALDVERRQFLTGQGRAPIQLQRNIGLRFFTARRELRSDVIGQIRFYPDGSSTGGRILLDLDNLTKEIEVDWLTGQVRITDDSRS